MTGFVACWRARPSRVAHVLARWMMRVEHIIGLRAAVTIKAFLNDVAMNYAASAAATHIFQVRATLYCSVNLLFGAIAGLWAALADADGDAFLIYLQNAWHGSVVHSSSCGREAVLMCSQTLSWRRRCTVM